ncbi:MAG: hypothetical protein MJ252_24335 [archaeon]|nr:hypothetical protein [archaeon]
MYISTDEVKRKMEEVIMLLRKSNNILNNDGKLAEVVEEEPDGFDKFLNSYNQSNQNEENKNHSKNSVKPKNKKNEDPLDNSNLNNEETTVEKPTISPQRSKGNKKGISYDLYKLDTEKQNSRNKNKKNVAQFCNVNSGNASKKEESTQTNKPDAQRKKTPTKNNNQLSKSQNNSTYNISTCKKDDNRNNTISGYNNRTIDDSNKKEKKERRKVMEKHKSYTKINCPACHDLYLDSEENKKKRKVDYEYLNNLAKSKSQPKLRNKYDKDKSPNRKGKNNSKTPKKTPKRKRKMEVNNTSMSYVSGNESRSPTITHSRNLSKNQSRSGLNNRSQSSKTIPNSPSKKRMECSKTEASLKVNKENTMHFNLPQLECVSYYCPNYKKEPKQEKEKERPKSQSQDFFERQKYFEDKKKLKMQKLEKRKIELELMNYTFMPKINQSTVYDQMLTENITQQRESTINQKETKPNKDSKKEDSAKGTTATGKNLNTSMSNCSVNTKKAHEYKREESRPDVHKMRNLINQKNFFDYSKNTPKNEGGDTISNNNNSIYGNNTMMHELLMEEGNKPTESIQNESIQNNPPNENNPTESIQNNNEEEYDDGDGEEYYDDNEEQS